MSYFKVEDIVELRSVEIPLWITIVTLGIVNGLYNEHIGVRVCNEKGETKDIYFKRGIKQGDGE